ncbi:hypothetical protein NZK35_31765 [Stieleria sp. ICT_E10.1]|nr:hypothetical protein [Stieleria sedimenti]
MGKAVPLPLLERNTIEMNQCLLRRISCVVAWWVVSPLAVYAEPVLFLADGNSSSL